MRSLDDEKIIEIEKTVRDDFEDILKNDEYDIFEIIDRAHIFGLFGGKVDRFRFMPGEKVLINKIVTYINSLKVDALNDCMEENLELSFHSEHFCMKPDTKISRKELCRSPIGYLFGKKTRNVPADSAQVANKSKTVYSKENVLQKCNVRLNPFNVQLTVEQINIINDGTRVFAYAPCPLCEIKSIAIQCDVPKNSDKPYWNVSNYNKHLEKHRKKALINNSNLEDDKPLNESNDIKTELNESSRTNSSNNLIDNESSLHANRQHSQNSNHSGDVEMASLNFTMTIQTEDSLTDSIYKQISEQNLKLTTAIMSHNETIEDMVFNLNSRRSINVIRMKMDGNCMFLALAHQIFLHKVDSQRHVADSKKLRREVVKHITGNFERFKQVITHRLIQEEGKYQLKGDSWDQKSKHFVKFILSKAKCWGGTESLKAISEIYSMNILTFNENDVCWLPFDFNDDYERIIALAFRINEEGVRNHYDSVSEVGPSLLYECAKLLAKNELKKIDLKNGDGIISLEESVDS